MSDLRKAAEAVLERWDSPAWEWIKQGPTAELMATLRAALAAPSEDIETLRRDAFRKGFYAGFAATGEGWNGEYPFQDMNRPIVGNPSVEAAIDEAMQEDKT